MNKEKRPKIDMAQKKLILSRLFGDNYAAKPDVEDTYIGYFKGVIVEAMFFGIFCTIVQRYGDYKRLKFANLVSDAFFNTKGLKATTAERINFDNTTCAHIGYDNISVSFYFWYRRKENAV